MNYFCTNHHGNSRGIAYILTSMRSWIRLAIPRVPRTKNLVTGPGTASCVPSVLPGVRVLPEEPPCCWLLPLPATSWKDRVVVNTVKLRAKGSAILGTLDHHTAAEAWEYKNIRGIELQSYVCCLYIYIYMGCKIAVCVAAPRPTPALPTLRCSHILYSYLRLQLHDPSILLLRSLRALLRLVILEVCLTGCSYAYPRPVANRSRSSPCGRGRRHDREAIGPSAFVWTPCACTIL